MLISRTLLACLTPVLLTACASHPSPEQMAGLNDESRATVGQFAQTLGGELKQAIKTSGPEAAISVCKEKAPAIAAAISEARGVHLRRVTFKQRNPKSVPDAWEARVLTEFEQRLARGETPASLEYSEVVEESGKKSYRFMKGLVVQEVCMTCHGTAETIPAGVKAKIATEYPGDQAIGYLPNRLRGAVSLSKPL